MSTPSPRDLLVTYLRQTMILDACDAVGEDAIHCYVAWWDADAQRAVTINVTLHVTPGHPLPPEHALLPNPVL